MAVRRAHANFTDPLGLLTRMLRSGDPAARAALIREFATAALAPVDWCLQVAEARRLRAAGSSILPVVLLVGSSRAGTTLVYQVLAHYLPFTYFTNLSALFPRAPLTAARLFPQGGPPTRPSFHSYYGNTTRLFDPNDGFHVWNRWLGTDRYRAPAALGPDTITAMRRFFAAWTQTFDRPFLNKNNRNADCVALLGRVLPEAVFVVVRRNPVDIAQSLLIAREHIQGDKRRKWGVRSRDQADDADPLGYVDSVCEQILDVEQRLAEGCRTLAPERVVTINYERFCAEPAGAISEISTRVWGEPIDTSRVARDIDLKARARSLPRVSPQELERIRHHLDAAKGAATA